ncbi:hypothetical protein C8R45DRAFT_1178668, partial [Mycena sanguinolenta]
KPTRKYTSTTKPLSNQAGELFKADDFEGAAKYYEIATQVAGNSVSIYLSNLAAAYLKLEKYRAAAHAADRALRLEPRAIKARYRRAMARKNLKFIPEALIDLASLLTTDPGIGEARAEFQTLTAPQNRTGRIERALTTEEILKADSPSAYGSSGNPSRVADPDPHLRGSTSFRRLKPMPHTKRIQPVSELKKCRKCGRVNDCSKACARANWSEHKLICNVAPDGNITFRTGRRIADHDYFRRHLLLYALRAIGPAKRAHEARPSILMVVVDMVPVSAAEPNGCNRTTVTNIVAVPTSILPPDVRDMLDLTPQNTNGQGPVHALWIVTSGIYPDGEATRCRVALLMPEDFISSNTHLPHFSLDCCSNSYGVFRRMNLDLDFLFESINDELRLDEEDYYGMRVQA